MALRWRNILSCNIKEIDDQHKKLFEISSKLNILAPICWKINFEDEILQVVNDLKDYSVYHFDFEENLMKKYNFEGFEEHCQEHESFVKKVMEIEQEVLNFNRAETVISIIDFVTGWITEHILTTDMKYKDYFFDNRIY